MITEYSLIDIDPIPIFEFIDIRSVTSRPEFPSEEFGDFMELLAKWNLSDACGSDILKFSKKICRDDVNLPTSVKQGRQLLDQDRKSTRLNSSHSQISYAVFCLKKKK